MYGGIFLIFILPNETSKGEKDRNGLNKFKFSNAIYLAFLSKALPIDSYNLEKKIYQHSKMEWKTYETIIHFWSLLILFIFV